MARFQPNSFNTQLWDCFDDRPSCLDGTFCPYCQLTINRNMLAYGKREVIPVMCCSMMFMDMLFPGLGMGTSASLMRAAVIERYKLTDVDQVVACYAGFCCPCCSICQVYREMSIRHEWPGGICADKPFQHPLGICAPEIPGMGALPISGEVLSGGANAQGGGAGDMPPYNSVYAGSGGGGYGQPPAAQQQQQYPPAQSYYYGNANPQYGQTQATAPPPPPPQQPAAKHEPYVSGAHQRV